MSELLLGVDGGATKTVALIADPAGSVVGAGRAGSSDIHNHSSPEAAVGEVVASVQAAMADAGAQPADLRRAVFSLCGCDWPEDVAYYASRFDDRLLLDGRFSVMNDAFGALRAGTADGIGVALVLGTGAAVAARGAAGTTWFSGERMEAIGALELGRIALDLIVRSEYGAGPAPSFRQDALDAYGASSVDELIYAITRTGGLGRRDLGRLAPAVLDAGQRGDTLVAPIIKEHGRLLAGYVRKAAERVSLQGSRPTVVTSGGVFRHQSAELTESFRAGLTDFEVVASKAEPVYGALLAAGDADGLDLDVAGLQATGPEDLYFATSTDWPRATT